MANHEAFLRSIAEEPSCDANRLVYADWLEEHDKPHEANYLRIELKLANLALEARQASPLRNQLWQAWAAVDPDWLRIITQPLMLRANPTPFPSAWMNFDLGNLREWQGTYGSWPYESLPPLRLQDMDGKFTYLQVERTTARREDDDYSMQYRQDFERMLAEAAENRVRLPESFVTFMKDPALHNTFRSVTDCYFALPDEFLPIQAGLFGDGMHVLFYRDSQDCLHWDLYVHPSGAHCVIARWPDYFDPQPPDPDDEEPPYTGPRAWFVAPSFEAFLYRLWLENQIWYLEHADFFRRHRQHRQTRPTITPAIQTYMDHYRNRNAEAEARPS